MIIWREKARKSLSSGYLTLAMTAGARLRRGRRADRHVALHVACYDYQVDEAVAPRALEILFDGSTAAMNTRALMESIVVIGG